MAPPVSDKQARYFPSGLKCTEPWFTRCNWFTRRPPFFQSKMLTTYDEFEPGSTELTARSPPSGVTSQGHFVRGGSVLVASYPGTKVSDLRSKRRNLT